MSEAKPQINASKVFCIGLYKTGTTSLHQFFQSYGLRSYHGPAWADWLKKGQESRFDDYDCFSDGMGHPLEYLHERYPDAKYIYSRRSLRSWMISRHMHRRLKARQLGYYFLILCGRKRLTGISFLDRHVRQWPADYAAHEQRVSDFFADKPGKLLEVDFFQEPPENVAERLHDFLGLAGEPMAIPKKNVAPSELRARSEAAVDRVLASL